MKPITIIEGGGYTEPISPIRVEVEVSGKLQKNVLQDVRRYHHPLTNSSVGSG
jgi:hypothetical protein